MSTEIARIFSEFYGTLDERPIEEDWPYQEPGPEPEFSERERLEQQLDAAEWVYRRYGFERLEPEIAVLRAQLESARGRLG